MVPHKWQMGRQECSLLRYSAPWLKGAYALNSKGEPDFRTWGKRGLMEPTLVAVTFQDGVAARHRVHP